MTSSHPSTASAAAHSTPTQNVHRNFGIGTLGEYYTPDWLAAKMVNHAIDRPLVEHVLDPACGSGTFLFHAVRVFLREAEESDMNLELRASEVCARVEGMDIHPVAVIIARVTYLLALAPVLKDRKGGLSIPVYLGDAMQLSISEIIGGKELTIRVPPPPAGKERAGRAIRMDARGSIFRTLSAAIVPFSTRRSSGCAAGLKLA